MTSCNIHAFERSIFPGLVTFMFSFGFLFFGLHSWRSYNTYLNEEVGEKLVADTADEELHPEVTYTKRLIFIIVSFALFLFFYVGIEYCTGMYLATYAVDSDLQVNKHRQPSYMCRVY